MDVGFSAVKRNKCIVLLGNSTNVCKAYIELRHLNQITDLRKVTIYYICYLVMAIESLVYNISSLFANVGYKGQFTKYQLSLTLANDCLLSIAYNECTGSLFDIC